MSVLYDTIGAKYHKYRKPEPKIAALMNKELEGARSVVNIGAGAGSYEPEDREVVAVEPSRMMISKRIVNGGMKVNVVQGCAEALPFHDHSFDAAMVILTMHHWSDAKTGLNEVMRVTRGRIILLTWIGFVEDFWLIDYVPQVRGIDESLFLSIKELEKILGRIRVVTVPIPHECSDGFLCAYWRRPHAYLEEGVRSAISTFAHLPNIKQELLKLDDDLASGVWYERYGHLLKKESMDFGYRLVVVENIGV